MGSCQSSVSAADAHAEVPATKPAATQKDDTTSNSNNSTSRIEESYVSENGKPTASSGSCSESNRHDKIKKWKDELGKSGNLTKAVVHIETSLDKTVEDVYEGVHNGKILGTGAAGVVRKCTHRQTGIEFAIKCLNIGVIESDEIIDALREEIFIMCQADHPDIIRLEEVYESDSQIYLILHMLTGGDMFDRLEEQPDYRYTEVQCAHIVNQMISSVCYLHANKVIHRDLKLENFLFDDPESDNIQLIDFGLSKHFDEEGDKQSLAVGTPYTIAPEIIKGEYDEKVDVWALGVITYLLLCGDPPFGGMDEEALITVRQKILDCDLVFEPKYIWDGISQEAKNFVKRMLTEDPKKRPSAAEAQQDEWLVKSASMEVDHGKPLNPDLVKNLMGFKDYTNLQKTLLEVVSFTLLPEQIKDMKDAFQKVDRDGSGEISLEELKEVLINYSASESESDSFTLTEEEVEMIFESLLIDTRQSTIKWHNFITAGLSRCDYDDRNLRLAFNRLDQDDKGFITINDLNEMLRSNDGAMDEAILNMWKDGLEGIQCKNKDQISFEDFQCFFKGHAPKQEDFVESTAAIAAAAPNISGRRMSIQKTGVRRRSKRVSVSSGLVLSSAFSLASDASSAEMTTSDAEQHNSIDSTIGENTATSARRSFARRRSSAILVSSRSDLRGPGSGEMGGSEELGIVKE
mmetsp:Transcript_23112/g.49213  ORF Transcript_23112/g.49213 Transcript_23112/m.49213 type:complete len:689 (+) Transcript_23112:185-2251(+)|eukprot:CAMPEP_0201131880 /NCGR_PEP_ID=MMETSP0850-20130426/44126_1 /ASSEMBLY_ACC=CAM_ASM_000622 /TAXON_ID=183588 /ORGANISM="Pseudo-nitzschia fraudulenta, Strain WWA7" /LENGTH=688 /DNA_ID=CAMNT_0047402059 /DNA_START=162 /DNA_END=2228 /DNA_ORIENTATION=-